MFWSFMEIAASATEGQILVSTASAMLDGYDVIDRVAEG